jgi:hypothetical protein
MGDDDALEQLESAVDQKLAVKDTTVLVEGPLCMVIAVSNVAGSVDTTRSLSCCCSGV